MDDLSTLRRISVGVVLSLAVFLGLGETKLEPKHSFSDPASMVVKKTHLDLTIDFDHEVVRGTATLSVQRLKGIELWLDTDMLTIRSVTGDITSFKKVVDPTISRQGFGEPLMIETKDQNDLTIVIDYETSPNASGLIWVDHDKTRSGEPFLFSMNEPIGARSWFPCQDIPSVRGVYTADLKIIARNRPSSEPLMALISGDNNPRTALSDMTYRNLKMTSVPIPSYLFSLAAGRFKYRALNDHIGFYADNDHTLTRAMSTLKDVPKYLIELDRLLGHNPWPRQDFLFLPKQFSFAGMENPMLIFVNESVVDDNDDASYVIAHELAHMWTGNLVTNSAWEDFWLNEGWSTYYEDRVLESIYGKTFADNNAYLTYEALLDGEKQRLNEPSSTLPSQPTLLHKVNAQKTHPRELIDFSVYAKGASMLHHIERIIGREHFDAYAKGYIKDLSLKPITSDKFIDYSVKKLKALRSDVDWVLYFKAWVFEPGLHPDHRLTNTPAVEIPKVQ